MTSKKLLITTLYIRHLRQDKRIKKVQVRLIFLKNIILRKELILRLIMEYKFLIIFGLRIINIILLRQLGLIIKLHLLKSKILHFLSLMDLSSIDPTSLIKMLIKLKPFCTIAFQVQINLHIIHQLMYVRFILLEKNIINKDNSAISGISLVILKVLSLLQARYMLLTAEPTRIRQIPIFIKLHRPKLVIEDQSQHLKSTAL